MKKILKRVKAWITGTFVAECPKCHESFLGTEKHHHSVKLEKHYRYVCDKCWKEHIKIK